MFGGPRSMLQEETSKPRRTGETLARLGHYFRPYWYALLLAVVFVTISTWAQVTSPELLGQMVDCYLAPAVGAGLPTAPEAGMQPAACWLEEGQTAVGPSRTLIKSLLTAGGQPAPAPGQDAAARLAGVGRMVLLLVGLYVISSLLTGLTFFAMTWAGQHVLTRLRKEVFAHLHRLDIGYYAENEAGDLMSRITNDTETINQAISFALVNVFSGVLLLVWIGYQMLGKSAPMALISMLVVPVMGVVTVWFSTQARK
ncbi:MAG: ABC transporter transmembrane domain-containing protein, partial [Chloroflexota bacterium]